ncbi:MAG: DUF402 domain-containing protein [Chloroflexi bacterium]|nr:DUF402 domain-containing protein [Chloroflexota bacterium]
MLTIHKADPHGRILTTYSACLLTDNDPILVLARWRHDLLQTPFVTFHPGDIFIERYDRRRYYNIFTIFSGEGISLSDHLCGVREQIRDEERLALTMTDILQTITQAYQAPCTLKGTYVNFTYPVEYDARQQSLLWRDLALDMWVPPQGSPLLLDEDEYADLDLPRHDPQADAAIQRQLRKLWQHALHRSGPFAQP